MIREQELENELRVKLGAHNLMFNPKHDCAPSDFEEGISLAVEHSYNYYMDEIKEKGVSEYVDEMINEALEDQYLMPISKVITYCNSLGCDWETREEYTGSSCPECEGPDLKFKFEGE